MEHQDGVGVEPRSTFPSSLPWALGADLMKWRCVGSKLQSPGPRRRPSLQCGLGTVVLAVFGACAPTAFEAELPGSEALVSFLVRHDRERIFSVERFERPTGSSGAVALLTSST